MVFFLLCWLPSSGTSVGRIHGSCAPFPHEDQNPHGVALISSAHSFALDSIVKHPLGSPIEIMADTSSLRLRVSRLTRIEALLWHLRYCRLL